VYLQTNEKLALRPLQISLGRAEAATEDERLFTWHLPTKKRKYGGWSRYSRTQVHECLKKLRESGRLQINDADIDVLQRIANVETSGRIQGINSYDSAYMSMGFMQWPIVYTDRYNPYGKLQRLIQRVPEAFQRYGIELDAPRRYRIKTPSGTYTPIAIKGAAKPGDLRSLDWAKRFYAAGLDPDVIVEEVKLALEVIEETKKHIENHKKYKIGSAFLPYYEQSAVLRALIQETFNNRPTYLLIALERGVARAKKRGEVSTDQFLKLVREAIKEVYREKDPEDGPKKAKNLIYKTSRLVL
jgi:hypothetical protein